MLLYYDMLYIFYYIIYDGLFYAVRDLLSVNVILTNICIIVDLYIHNFIIDIKVELPNNKK